jgi:hypothetical protein
MAQSTKRVCRDCGFLLPLAGSLGAMFGVCGNELSADGHIVDFEYGCGAHSDTPAPAGSGSPIYDPFDDGVLDVSEKPAEAPIEEAAEALAEVAVEESAEAEAEAVVEEPVALAVEESAEAPAEEPTEPPVEEPAEPS